MPSSFGICCVPIFTLVLPSDVVASFFLPQPVNATDAASIPASARLTNLFTLIMFSPFFNPCFLLLSSIFINPCRSTEPASFQGILKASQLKGP